MGSKEEKMLYSLFDSEATFSCISQEFAEIIGNPEKMLRPIEVETAAKGHYLKIDYALRTDFYFEDTRLSDEFMVVPDLSEEVIIGVNTMQKWRIKLDYEHDSVYVDPKVAKIILKDMKTIYPGARHFKETNGRLEEINIKPG